MTTCDETWLSSLWWKQSNLQVQISYLTWLLYLHLSMLSFRGGMHVDSETSMVTL